MNEILYTPGQEDVTSATQSRFVFAHRIAKIAFAAGVYNDQVVLTGPLLQQLLGDLSHLRKTQQLEAVLDWGMRVIEADALVQLIELYAYIVKDEVTGQLSFETRTACSTRLRNMILAPMDAVLEVLKPVQESEFYQIGKPT